MDEPAHVDAAADERYLLGKIAGLCNQQPLDGEMLAILIQQLEMASRDAELAATQPKRHRRR